MNSRIACTIDAFTAEASRILREVGTLDCVEWSQAELREQIGNYDVLVVQLGLRIDAEILQSASRLTHIATATTGTDHIDLEAAAAAGIQVISLRGETEFLRTVPSTAEHAFGLLLALVRGTVAAHADVCAYHWRPAEFRGRELRGKTLGIMGVGRLGSMVARYGQSFGMRVIGYDPAPFDACESVTFDTLLRESDVVSLHMPLQTETTHLLDAKACEQMKQGAYLINTARGGVVDESALLEALASGRLAGYATDVLAGESAFSDLFRSHPLVEYARAHPSVIITPHIGGMTAEARAATDVFIATRLRDELIASSAPA